MKPPPFIEELQLVILNDPERLPGVGSAHVMVLPESGRRAFVAEADQDFTSSCALHVDMRRPMFSRRRVDVHLERSFFVNADHDRS
jgi:hypothetical protein